MSDTKMKFVLSIKMGQKEIAAVDGVLELKSQDSNDDSQVLRILFDMETMLNQQMPQYRFHISLSEPTRGTATNS